MSGKLSRRTFVTGAAAYLPLPGARLDLWQADSSAHYDLTGYVGRGLVVADAAGAFRFSTVVPGPYLDHGRYRPAHIHATISPPDGRSDLH